MEELASKSCTLAIGFFGLVRNIKHTLKSMQVNLTGSLSVDCNVSLFAHTLSVQALTNSRSNEYNERVDSRDILKLDMVRFEIQDQESLDDLFHNLTGPYDNNTNRNVFRAMYSMQRVATLISLHEEYLSRPFDLWLFARPDVRYVRTVRVPSGRRTAICAPFSGSSGSRVLSRSDTAAPREHFAKPDERALRRQPLR